MKGESVIKDQKEKTPQLQIFFKSIKTDFEDFCKKINIFTKGGDEIPFILNKIQLLFVKNMHTRNVVVKPRQVGFSTLCKVLILYLAANTKNLNVGILYQDEKAVRANGREIQQFFLDHGKSVGVSIASKASSITEFIVNPSNTRICIDTAGAANPFRSQRMNFILASEVGFWTNVNRALDSLVPSVSDDGIVIYESSPSIEGIKFKEIYNKAKDEREANKAQKTKLSKTRLKPFFFSFLEFDEYMIDPPKNWHMTPDDAEFIRKTGASVKQAYFRRDKLGPNPSTDDYNMFKTNYPIDDVTCFESSGSSSAFNVEKLGLFKEMAPANIADKRYSSTPIESYKESSFRLYEPYNENRKYFIGVDTAKGEGGDENAVVVISVNKRGDRLGKIAAIYSSNSVAFTDFHRIIGNISVYFGNAHILVESNTYGDAVLHLLRQVHINGKIKSLFHGAKSKEKTISNVEHFILSCNMENDSNKLKDQQLIQQLKKFSTNVKEAKHQQDDLVIAFGLALESKKRNFDRRQNGFAFVYDESKKQWL